MRIMVKSRLLEVMIDKYLFVEPPLFVAGYALNVAIVNIISNNIIEINYLNKGLFSFMFTIILMSFSTGLLLLYKKIEYEIYVIKKWYILLIPILAIVIVLVGFIALIPYNIQTMKSINYNEKYIEEKSKNLKLDNGQDTKHEDICNYLKIDAKEFRKRYRRVDMDKVIDNKISPHNINKDIDIKRVIN